MKWPYPGCILAPCMMRDWKNMCQARLVKSLLDWRIHFTCCQGLGRGNCICSLWSMPKLPLWFWDCTCTARYLLHDKTQVSKYLLGPCRCLQDASVVAWRTIVFSVWNMRLACRSMSEHIARKMCVSANRLCDCACKMTCFLKSQSCKGAQTKPLIECFHGSYS